MEKVTLLAIGDGGCATGFARVMHSILNNLPKDIYDVKHLAVNYYGDPYEAEHEMFPAMLGGDPYGLGRVKPMMNKFEPDLVFVLNDPWGHEEYLKRLAEFPETKVITYFPVDAKPQKPSWVQTLVNHTMPVAYNEFGRSALLDYYPEADVRVIPHGIDTDTFYPMDMQDARSKMDSMEPDEFVFLNANRNQPRKRVDLTIKGFALFAKDKPENVKLYLHMGVVDAGWNVIELARRYGIEKRLILTSLELSPASFVEDERLNWIYNACNVGINNSMGEGWGLTTFEHGACRRAQIITKYSSGDVIYPDDVVYKLPVSHFYTNPGILTEGAVVSPIAVAKSMEFMYSNPEARKTYANKVYDFVTQPEFKWENIGQRWHELFMEVLDSDLKIGEM